MEVAAPYTIVNLSEDSWRAAKDLRVRSVREEPRAYGQTPEEALAVSEEKWREELREGHYLFVESGGSLSGMACLVPEKLEKLRHTAWIYNVYIAPELRGRGAGREMLTRLINEGKEKYPQLVKVMLYASCTQTAALSLYESLGFQKVGLLEKHMLVAGEFVDEWEMVKFL